MTISNSYVNVYQRVMFQQAMVKISGHQHIWVTRSMAMQQDAMKIGGMFILEVNGG